MCSIARPNPLVTYMLLRNDEKDKTERVSLGMKYVIDTSLFPSQLKEEEAFASYLANKCMYIDVWDGDRYYKIIFWLYFEFIIQLFLG